MKGFVIYPTYRVLNGKSQVMLFGKLENGESFVTINDFMPYFWIKRKDKERCEQIIKEMGVSITINNEDYIDFDDDKVSKVIVNIPREVPELRKIFLDKNIACYEADVRFSYRFMMDHNIKGSLDIEGNFRKPSAEDKLTVDRIYENAEVKGTEYWPKLDVLSIDIETSMDGNKIFAISLYSEKVKKVLLVKEGNYKNADCFKTEKDMLIAFKEHILSLDPDVIIGWNLIDFDFMVLKEKFKAHKIPFVLGRNDRECNLNINESFFNDSSANFPGRAIIDGIHLMKVSFIRLDDYKLNTAAKTILGDEKLLTQEHRGKEIEELYEKDPQRLVDYNLKDSVLVYDLINKANVLDLSIRRSLLTGMQLDRVNASIASLDSLYLRELKARKIVAPSVASNEREERIKGGFVMASKPGIYKGIIVLDFKSLYPSIIRTFNIDPYSFVPNEKYIHLNDDEKRSLIESPNKAHFRNELGILPDILARLWKQRDIAKKEKDQLSSQAIKILMNSFFGVLANPNCRFYSLEMANGITHFGQFLNKLTAKKIEEEGYEVIYGDTDSIFVNVKDIKHAEKIGKELQDYINDFYNRYVEENFKRKSYLELEFEKSFEKFLMPKVRGSEVGAKKRYAGLIEKNGKKEIVIVGLEFVRRDWTEVSKQFQMGLLEHIFNDEPYEKFVRDFVNDLKTGKMDKLLVYKKSIRKGVSQYTKTTPPHIKAARILGRELPGIIEYVMTVNGPEPLEKTSSSLDYGHYIEKQIKPIADSMLSFQDRSFDDLLQNHKQMSLGSFG
ncbi:MAG: DNA polymerase II [Nanoarchaeota archaeon]